MQTKTWNIATIYQQNVPILIILLHFSIYMKYYFLTQHQKNCQEATSTKKTLEIYCTYLNQNQQKISTQFMIHKKMPPENFNLKSATNFSSPLTLHHHYLNSSKTSHCQKSGNQIKHICDLGAIVGDERIKRVCNTP